jgi:hypothetical protein
MGVCSSLIVIALTTRLLCGRSSICNYNSGSLSDGIREFISDFKEMTIRDVLVKITVTLIKILIVLFGLLLIISFMVAVVNNTVADVMTVQLLP